MFQATPGVGLTNAGLQAPLAALARMCGAVRGNAFGFGRREPMP